MLWFMYDRSIYFDQFDRDGNVKNAYTSDAKIQMKFLFSFMWSARRIAIIPKGMHYRRKINALLRMHTQRAHWMSCSLVNCIIRTHSRKKRKLKPETFHLSFHKVRIGLWQWQLQLALLAQIYWMRINDLCLVLCIRSPLRSLRLVLTILYMMRICYFVILFFFIYLFSLFGSHEIPQHRNTLTHGVFVFEIKIKSGQRSKCNE